MKFFVGRWRNAPQGASYPLVVLTIDNWDDFGHKTLFHAHFWSDGNTAVDLGAVKILCRDHDTTSTEIPREFEQLDPARFCSLGADLDYYKALVGLAKHTWHEILVALVDVVVSPDASLWRQDDEGFHSSLLRFSTQALEEGALVLGLSKKTDKYRKAMFTFTSHLENATRPHSLSFHFDESSPLPRRMAILIGHNGTGKTTLLRNLSAAVGGWGLVNGDIKRRPEELGSFPNGRPSVGPVVAVSFSAFDDFQRPKESLAEQDAASVSYRYVGNRSPLDDQRFLTTAELGARFQEFIDAARKRRPDVRGVIIDCEDLLNRTLSRVFNQALVTTLVSGQGGKSPDAAWLSLSSGQRIAAFTISGLVASLSEGSMVFWDEPETHLHPGLLSTLLAAFHDLLSDFSSFAVVATHHPFVIQQVPTESVQVLHRSGNMPIITRVRFQTFGAELGEVLQAALGLAEPEKDWHHVMDRLVEEHGEEGTAALFSPGLGVEARTYLRSCVRG